MSPPLKMSTWKLLKLQGCEKSKLLKLFRKRATAPRRIAGRLLAFSHFFVRIQNENKYTMVAACGSLA
jgi:hypothetical protein